MRVEMMLAEDDLGVDAEFRRGGEISMTRPVADAPPADNGAARR